MKKTTSNIITLTQHQFDKICTILDKYYFNMYNIDFGNQEFFWICGYDWLTVKDKQTDQDKIKEFCQDIQTILNDDQILTIQSINADKLAFPFILSQITITNHQITQSGTQKFFNETNLIN